MSNPNNSITTFNFSIDSFSELNDKMTEAVGYEVRPSDVWAIYFKEIDFHSMMVTLCIIYWKEN